ncbi:hypothetical protein P3S68_032307 [Capsicum galapagoense]
MRRLSTLKVGSPRIRSLPLSLTGLSHLFLYGCEVLESIPDTIRNLRILEIILRNKLATLPNSLFESEQLELVNMYHNSRSLPRSIQMESLEQLMITNCPKLDTFPEINGDMHCLKEMTLDSIGIRELPSAIENLFGLESLNLEGCEDLVSPPNSLCNLKNLQHLYLCGCKKLEKLPENIGDLKELETLDARETVISQLPPSITKLVKLGELSFSRVVKHVQHSSIFVFHQLSALSYLNELHLNNLNILGGLPETLGSLQSLEHLDVSGSNISVKITFIQCEFHQKNYFLISFPEVRSPELFDDQFINQKDISIELNPSWYTDKFMGFSIFCGCNAIYVGLVATLVCKSDPERKHSLKYCRENAYWGIRLEYENKDRRWRRKQRATQSPKIFPVPRKDTSLTTKSVCYIVLEQPEPSLPSSSLASTEHDIATDSGLYLGYEKKSLEVDQATMTVQKEHKSQNVQLIRVCGSPSRKMDDTSRKRKRRRNRKKRRKIAGTDESSLHDFDGS